jgi:hypothetical protein
MYGLRCEVLKAIYDYRPRCHSHRPRSFPNRGMAALALTQAGREVVLHPQANYYLGEAWS